MFKEIAVAMVLLVGVLSLVGEGDTIASYSPWPIFAVIYAPETTNRQNDIYG